MSKNKVDQLWNDYFAEYRRRIDEIADYVQTEVTKQVEQFCEYIKTHTTDEDIIDSSYNFSKKFGEYWFKQNKDTLYDEAFFKVMFEYFENVLAYKDDEIYNDVYKRYLKLKSNNIESP